MKWTRPFRRTDRVRAAATALRLRHVRFRQLLLNVRELTRLVDDGRDKMGGDYILDRHYVESLLDTVIETAGIVVFDACILVPKGAGALYARFDGLMSRARKMLVAEGGGEGVENGLEPEYRLLSEVLEWIDGSRPGVGLAGFVHDVFDHVIHGWGEAVNRVGPVETRTFLSGGIHNVIQLLDTDRVLLAREGVEARSGEDRGRILRLLFVGFEEEGSVGDSDAGVPERRWIAVEEGRHLSVRRAGSGPVLRIEACPAGHVDDEGILFVYAGEGIDLGVSLASAGFRVEQCARGSLAWVCSNEAEGFEQGLVRLGLHVCGAGV